LKHSATPEFWTAFAALPEQVQALARKNFELLKADPKHPSLRFKKVGRFWSVRVGGAARWRLKPKTPSFGFGSADTTNTSA